MQSQPEKSEICGWSNAPLKTTVSRAAKASVFILCLFARDLAFAEPLATEPSRAPAKASSEVSLEEARAAFLEGMSLIKQQKWDEAAERFLVAASVRRTPGLLYYVAYCREQQGQYAAALELYQEAQDLVDKVAAADVEALLPQAIARTDAALVHFSISISPSSAVLKVNGQVRTVSSVQRLDPGHYELEVTAPNYQSWHETIDIKSGERRIFEVELVRSPPEELSGDEALPKARKQDDSIYRAKPYVVGATAVVALSGLGLGIYGTVRHVQAARRSDELGHEIDDATGTSSSGCVDPENGLAELCDELTDSIRTRKQGTAFMIAGYTTFGVGLAASLALQFLWTAPHVDVALGHDGGMVRFSGSF